MSQQTAREEYEKRDSRAPHLQDLGGKPVSTSSDTAKRELGSRCPKSWLSKLPSGWWSSWNNVLLWHGTISIVSEPIVCLICIVNLT